MNEAEIKWRKQLLKSLANITDYTSSEYEIIANGVKTISFLQQDNEKLKERIEYLERSNNRREDTILEQKQKISDLEDKVDKAIKYIEKFIPIDEDTILMRERQRDYLLDILKEVSE